MKAIPIGAMGLRVIVLEAVDLLSVALIEVCFAELTANVLIVKLAELAFWGTTTDAGTVTKVESPLPKPTVTPPAGATALRVTVPTDVEPPTVDAGLSATETGASGFIVTEP